ncbi:hypothetical protein PACILC2_01690 [Paenibacillus cisolokensis]|uniref:Uncharacterized protein n=1 Tax=Paenibacillus cisolokensis TaxID=1658519 RepID=A0ABQ4N0A9_9BACL|nr:hypothetical protein PACILC2_01690 [Paenibacillus cisolokensis]
MFRKQPYAGTREEQYELLLRQLTGLIEDETNRIANLANAAALLGQFWTISIGSDFIYWKETSLCSDRFRGSRPVSGFRLAAAYAGRP